MREVSAEPSVETPKDPGPRLPHWVPRRRPPLPVSVVRVPPGQVSLPMPADCAACGAPAAESLREPRRGASPAVIVPYCTTCHFHATATGTRRFAMWLASMLVSLALAFAVPLSGLGLPLSLHVAIVVLGGLLPIVVGQLEARRPRVRRAVWWLNAGELACTRSAFAAELAVGLGGKPEARKAREPLVSSRVLSGMMVSVAFTPLIHQLSYPRVRVVNLTPARITVVVDGRPAATLGPTSQESTRAGAELSLLVGTRHLEVRAPNGSVVDERDVSVSMLDQHLYAPGADGICFWLERTAYGRGREVGVDRVVEPLGVGSRFFSIDASIDTWFSPNPVTGDDDRSTGGELTALRHAPCLEAPRAVRSLLAGRIDPGTFAPPRQ